jgi:hypothetical protein
MEEVRGRFRVVTGLLAGHNTMRRNFKLMGPTNRPSCRCGAEVEISAHVL